MSRLDRITSAALALALGFGIAGAAAAREPAPEHAPAVESHSGQRHPGHHSRWREHVHPNVMPYAFGMNPVYVYSYPYVGVYSAPFSPGTIHYVQPGQVTVIQPMAWE